MQEIYDLFSADYDFLVQIVEKLRRSQQKRSKTLGPGLSAGR